MPARSWPLVTFLVLVPLACWAWIVVLARDMYGPMTGASAWTMTLRWDAPHLFLLMLLLFAGGVMNLVVIAAVTVFVALERLTALGARSARASGGLLIALAVWVWFARV
jgi:predicted metal-binding membrane protein